VLATLRNESVAFYASTMGGNFFLLSSTYIGAADNPHAATLAFQAHR